MQTLIIYDNTGKIFYQVSGDVIVPDGLQHILTDVPNGFYAESVNVATKEVMLKEYPKSETQQLQEQLTETQLALVEQFEVNLSLQDEVTNTQLAIAELFESVVNTDV